MMVKKRVKRPEYFECPHCGAAVRVGSRACRECGSDAETGWSEDADLWQADIPAAEGDDDEFDYEEFVAREFPDHADAPPARVIRRWATVVLVTIVGLAFVLWSLSR